MACDQLATVERRSLTASQEATQLARLTPERLDATPARARRLHAEVMLAHTLARGSQNALRTRIKEILGEVVTISGKEMAGVVEKIDELLEIDPSDKRHLFYEELKRFFYATRETMPEDIDDDSLYEFMTAADSTLERHLQDRTEARGEGEKRA